MRTLMMIASVAMVVSGIFCVANGSAAFLTVAFIVGLVYLVMGLSEVFVGMRADFDMSENAVSITRDGAAMTLYGLVVISGQVTDNTAALMLMAMWLMIEGILAFNTDLDLMDVSVGERLHIVINILLLALGLYMFFNNTLFNFYATFLIGIGLIVLGFRRFLLSFRVEYNRPSFITGNEEKLREALEDEKRALAKAKEGIREQKAVQRRIAKIREDIAAEQDMRSSVATRRAEREQERAERERQ